MRCIADGALDGATEDALATRLGVSARHLRRLFDEHVGATPAEVARSRRAHFARRLLDDTDLPIAAASATAAGFNSVRQFNRVDERRLPLHAHRSCGAPPAGPDRLVTDGGLELRMPYRAPLAWADAARVPRAARDPGRRDRRPGGRASTAASSSSAARPA